jgi:hypothetical protein
MKLTNTFSHLFIAPFPFVKGFLVHRYSLLNILRSLFLTLLLAFSNQATAQTPTSWTKYYKGRLDDMSDIALTLSSNAGNCTGQITYLRSKETFRLEGTLKKDTLLLNELDAKAAVSGHILGFLKKNKITATWRNFDERIGGLTLKLSETEKEANEPSFCGNNKWIQYYRGIIDNDEVDILLQKNSDNEVRGTGYAHKENVTYALKGVWEEAANTLELTFKHPETNRKTGTFKGKFRNNDEIIGNFVTYPKAGKVFATFSKDDGLSVGCMDYADYTTLYDVLYPKTKSEEFNTWIEKIVYDWVNRIKETVQQAKGTSNENTPNLRAIARAYTTSTVEFYSQDLISGYLIFNNSWENAPQEQTMNYDFTAKKELLLSDIFKQGYDYQTFIKEYTAKEVLKNALYNQGDFKTWIESVGFPNFSILRDGLKLSTPTNGIFGRQSVTIPYAQVKANLKQQGSVWNLAK